MASLILAPDFSFVVKVRLCHVPPTREGQEGLGTGEQNVTKNRHKSNFFASNQLYVSRTCVFASLAPFSVQADRK